MKGASIYVLLSVVIIDRGDAFINEQLMPISSEKNLVVTRGKRYYLIMSVPFWCRLLFRECFEQSLFFLQR